MAGALCLFPWFSYESRHSHIGSNSVFPQTSVIPCHPKGNLSALAGMQTFSGLALACLLAPAPSVDQALSSYWTTCSLLPHLSLSLFMLVPHQHSPHCFLLCTDVSRGHAQGIPPCAKCTSYSLRLTPSLAAESCCLGLDSFCLAAKLLVNPLPTWIVRSLHSSYSAGSRARGNPKSENGTLQVCNWGRQRATTWNPGDTHLFLLHVRVGESVKLSGHLVL